MQHAKIVLENEPNGIQTCVARSKNLALSTSALSSVVSLGATLNAFTIPYTYIWVYIYVQSFKRDIRVFVAPPTLLHRSSSAQD